MRWSSARFLVVITPAWPKVPWTITYSRFIPLTQAASALSVTSEGQTWVWRSIWSYMDPLGFLARFVGSSYGQNRAWRIISRHTPERDHTSMCDLKHIESFTKLIFCLIFPGVFSVISRPRLTPEWANIVEWSTTGAKVWRSTSFLRRRDFKTVCIAIWFFERQREVGTDNMNIFSRPRHCSLTVTN